MKKRTIRKIVCGIMIAMYACCAFERTDEHVTDYTISESVAFVETNK